MPDEADFLQAILDDPDNDGPRLIYADWLEERGDPRGEFIRVQCELARMADDSERWRQLKLREQALLGDNEHNWIEESVRRLVNSYEFQRGLLTFIELNAKGFSHYSTLARIIPVHRLRITGPFRNRRPSVETIGSTPALAQLISLEIVDGYYHIGPREVACLARSPHLYRLSTLILTGNPTGAAGAAAIASASHLPRLRSLALWCYGFNSEDFVGDEGIRSLASSPLLAQLTQLSLRGNRITCVGCRAIAAAPAITNLASLDLSHNWRL